MAAESSAPPRVKAVERLPDKLILRFGLFAAGLIAWKAATRLWDSGTVPMFGWSQGMMLAGYVVGFACLLLAIRRDIPKRAMSGVIGAYVLTFASFAFIDGTFKGESGTPLTTDAWMYMDFAARLLSRGENPYEADMVAAFEVYRSPFNFSTPMADGSLTDRVAYPALSFLIMVPAQLVGFPTTWVYPLFLIASLILAFRGVDERLRPLVLLPFFADDVFPLYALGGVTDTVWSFLLVLTVLDWKHVRRRGIWFGLACAYKHQPWLLAPFLLIRIWREEDDPRRRKKALLTFVGLTTLVFLVVNLPFIVWNPEAWLLGILEPVRRPMITFGQGLSSLTMTGIVMIPKAVYTGMMASVFAFMLWIYWRHFESVRELVWIAPAIALWFGNRGLTSYWYFNTLPLVVALFGAHLARARSQPPTRTASARLPLVVGAALAVAMVGVVVGYRMRDCCLEVTVERPVYVNGNHAHRIAVTVTNKADYLLEPRFMIQSVGYQPFFWRAADGPIHLQPGETATYELESIAVFTEFDIARGARLTVADAHSPDWRTAVEIPGRPEFTAPDVIPNGGFWYATEGQDAPAFWGIGREGVDGDVMLAPGHLSAPPTVDFGIRKGLHPKWNLLVLDTYVMLPERAITIQVNVPETANDLDDLNEVYGLRLLVNEQEVWVLFGDEAADGWIDADRRYVVLPTPRGTWTTQTLHLRELLTALGVDLTPGRHAVPRFPHLDFVSTPINFQLMLGVRGDRPAHARFGRLATNGMRPDVRAMVDVVLSDPGRVELWKTDYAEKLRNFEAAAHGYSVIGDRVSGDAAFRRGEASFWAEDWDAAVAAYRASIGAGVEIGRSYKGLGWALFNQGSPEAAVAAWRDAVAYFEKQGNPSDSGHLADCYKGIALASARLGDCLSAQQSLAAAKRLASNMPLVDILGQCDNAE